MNRRIQQILELESLTQAQFAERINVGRASISHILNGRNKPGYDIIQSILKQFPKISPDWLILGKGKPYRETETASVTNTLNSGDNVSHTQYPDNEIFTKEFEDIFPPENPIIETSNTDTGSTDEPKRAIASVKKRIKRITVYYDDNTFEEFFR